MVIAIAITISGCRNADTSESPVSAPVTAGSSSESPESDPTTASTDPGPTIVPPSSDKGLLAMDKTYYYNGDSNTPLITFKEDGTFIAESFIGEYRVVGETVEIMIDGEIIDKLHIRNGYILESTTDDTLFIREGGEGFIRMIQPFNSVGVRILFFDEYYYISGDEENTGLCFRNDGKVDLKDPEGQNQGVYNYIEGVGITVSFEDQPELILQTTDAATLTNSIANVSFMLKGAQLNQLEIAREYYFNGDLSLEHFKFESNGNYILSSSDGTSWEGTYSIGSDTVFAELDGDIAGLRIINSYVLEFQNEFLFIRMPDN